MNKTSDYYKILTEGNLTRGEIVPCFKYDPEDELPADERWNGFWETDDGREGFCILLTWSRAGRGWSVHALGTDDDDMSRWFSEKNLGVDRAYHDALNLWAFIAAQTSTGISKSSLRKLGLEPF